MSRFKGKIFSDFEVNLEISVHVMTLYIYDLVKFTTLTQILQSLSCLSYDILSFAQATAFQVSISKFSFRFRWFVTGCTCSLRIFGKVISALTKEGLLLNLVLVCLYCIITCSLRRPSAFVYRIEYLVIHFLNMIMQFEFSVHLLGKIVSSFRYDCHFLYSF